MLAVVALALIDNTGRVLMQRRPANRTHGGLWEFPGGKVEPGEGPRAALVREIKEELGIVIALNELFPVNFAVHEPSGSNPVQELPLLLLYECRHWQGTPACEPGAALVWDAPEALEALPMPPLDVLLLLALLRYERTAVK